MASGGQASKAKSSMKSEPFDQGLSAMATGNEDISSDVSTAGSDPKERSAFAKHSNLSKRPSVANDSNSVMPSKDLVDSAGSHFPVQEKKIYHKRIRSEDIRAGSA